MSAVVHCLLLCQVVLSTCVDLFQILRKLGLRSRTRIRLYSQIWCRNCHGESEIPLTRKGAEKTHPEELEACG